ncbi:MAG: hypothetical protein WC026_16720 [Hyphomicrobium sp.]|uniref:hypothetical protein n=1 Tax=Hyphomicrobium sp. TaxID=82 RepID=UPI003569739E
MISDATQLAALDFAIEVATGRRKLNASEAALFQIHIAEIRQRIVAAALRREKKTEARQ